MGADGRKPQPFQVVRGITCDVLSALIVPLVTADRALLDAFPAVAQPLPLS